MFVFKSDIHEMWAQGKALVNVRLTSAQRPQTQNPLPCRDNWYRTSLLFFLPPSFLALTTLWHEDRWIYISSLVCEYNLTFDEPILIGHYVLCSMLGFNEAVGRKLSLHNLMKGLFSHLSLYEACWARLSTYRSILTLLARIATVM